MNVSMTNAIYCDPQRNEYSFENLFIQSRNIRYVHVPETVSIKILITFILLLVQNKCHFTKNRPK
jgi:hypothetical protein